MSHNSQQNPRNPSRRPATIAELAQAALDNLWDERRDLKHYLRTAEKYRRDARKYINEGDLESAFIEFARAATLVLEKLPSHRDFHTLLNANQRHNLTLVSTFSIINVDPTSRAHHFVYLPYISFQ